MTVWYTHGSSLQFWHFPVYGQNACVLEGRHGGLVGTKASFGGGEWDMFVVWVWLWFVFGLVWFSVFFCKPVDVVEGISLRTCCFDGGVCKVQVFVHAWDAGTYRSHLWLLSSREPIFCQSLLRTTWRPSTCYVFYQRGQLSWTCRKMMTKLQRGFNGANVQICALFALGSQPSTAPLSDWYHFALIEAGIMYYTFIRTWYPLYEPVTSTTRKKIGYHLQ